jgi:hypothetical protein
MVALGLTKLLLNAADVAGTKMTLPTQVRDPNGSGWRCRTCLPEPREGLHRGVILQHFDPVIQSDDNMTFCISDSG